MGSDSFQQLNTIGFSKTDSMDSSDDESNDVDFSEDIEIDYSQVTIMDIYAQTPTGFTSASHLEGAFGVDTEYTDSEALSIQAKCVLHFQNKIIIITFMVLNKDYESFFTPPKRCALTAEGAF
jgi:hypothetical protein